jgi:receptor-binding and translocation channel-forming TcA subunit of Tc toxin
VFVFLHLPPAVQEVDQYLHDKFTNEDLYLWMQGEISRLYFEYYRFAFETARKAERTMKQELMRPEVDARDFVKFNYWDGGRKGLLSGEALYLDVKGMEMAYHENNKREIELTKHVSLRQLNPLALLTLKAKGSCQVTIPEWLYDLDCPGHYMRRIKSVALSIPSVVGPYTSINCTLSLLKSSIRKSSEGSYEYGDHREDTRFVNYIGAVQSIVTSMGQNDSGLFETNLRDERFLPFEGAGAESTWKLDLPNPNEYPAFDYTTISDVILHIRYTVRQGVIPSNVTTALKSELAGENGNDLGLLFSLRHDFPNEWAAFLKSPSETREFSATIRMDHFPYFVQQKQIHVQSGVLVDGASAEGSQPIDDLKKDKDVVMDIQQPTYTFSAPSG